MTGNLGEKTQTTTSEWTEVLKVHCPDFVSWNRLTFQVYEGTLSGSTLTGVNAVKYKVQGSNVDKPALYTDLQAEQTLAAGAVSSEEVAQQFIYVRLIAKDAVDGTHGKINVNAAGF